MEFWSRTWKEFLLFEDFIISLETYCESLGALGSIVFFIVFTWPVDNDWYGHRSLRCTLSNGWDKWGVEGPMLGLLAPSWRWCCWAGSVVEGAAGWALALGGDWCYLWPCWLLCRTDLPAPVCLPAWAPHTMSITSITSMVPFPSPSTGCPSSREEATVSLAFPSYRLGYSEPMGLESFDLIKAGDRALICVRMPWIWLATSHVRFDLFLNRSHGEWPCALCTHCRSRGRMGLLDKSVHQMWCFSCPAASLLCTRLHFWHRCQSKIMCSIDILSSCWAPAYVERPVSLSYSSDNPQSWILALRYRF